MEAAVNDTLLPNPDLPIRLPAFEGPLDLLLFLIRRNEVDIYDIPIESVTQQYLRILRQMEDLNLEVAGDFFVMAATLMYIKSRMLLPTNEQLKQPEEEEEEVDPRWELVQQLLEYKKFKEAAHELRDLVESQQDYMARHFSPSEDLLETRPLHRSDRIEIWNMFNSVLRRLARQMAQGEIHDDPVTVADRMEYLLDYMENRPIFRFSELFEGRDYNINQIVATFLALLELTRLKKLTLAQDTLFSDITCSRSSENENESDSVHMNPPENMQPTETTI